MSKRSVLGVLTEDDLSKPLKLSKPSLDSDEEDYDENNAFRLHEADIEGQEAATIEYDDLTEVTPFNMKEELEEDGHFDANGTFIFKKAVDARDNWLEDVNWLEVRRRQENNPLKNTAISDEPPDVPLNNEQKLNLYQQLLKFLQPSETVLRSIKRMGACSDVKKSASASQRWLRKAKVNEQGRCGDPEGLIRVTELADQLVQAGDFDIYQKAYEDIAKIVADAEQSQHDDELEALGQAFDEKPASDLNATNPNHSNETKEETTMMWHLKRSPDPDAQIEGPYSSNQLRRWVDEGKFQDAGCVLVRDARKPSGQFYNISRIDFDLYE